MYFTLTPDATGIYGLSYNKRMKRLTVVFRSKTGGRGGRYRYKGVPAYVPIAALSPMNAYGSVTLYIVNFVKGQYPCEKVLAA
jgi:hypothetical protein